MTALRTTCLGFALLWLASCTASKGFDRSETDGSTASVGRQDGGRPPPNQPYEGGAGPEGGDEPGSLPVGGHGSRDGAVDSVDSALADTRADADDRTDAHADAGADVRIDVGTTGDTDAGTDGRVSDATENCSEEGALRCVANASAMREICRDGVWQSAERCSEDEVCDTSNTDEPGTCVEATASCRGSTDTFVCADGIMHQCNADAISVSQYVCQSQAHCEVGLPRGQCAVCIPGSRTCTESGDPAVCDDEGQGWNVQTCDSDTPVCVGEGICVECADEDDCDSSRPICSSNTCVECITSTDCDASNPAAWSCENHECAYQSGCGNQVLDSGEECDDGSPEDPLGFQDWDGCGKECQINATWGCPISGTATYADNSSGKWVWAIPHPDNGIATCALPCGPYLGADGQVAGIHGTCEEELGLRPVPGTDPQVYLECINGACVIPCDGPGDSCPPGYECENPTVLDMDAYIASGGTSTATTNRYYGCMAQSLYRK